LGREPKENPLASWNSATHYRAEARNQILALVTWDTQTRAPSPMWVPQNITLLLPSKFPFGNGIVLLSFPQQTAFHLPYLSLDMLHAI